MITELLKLGACAFGFVAAVYWFLGGAVKEEPYVSKVNNAFTGVNEFLIFIKDSKADDLFVRLGKKAGTLACGSFALKFLLLFFKVRVDMLIVFLGVIFIFFALFHASVKWNTQFKETFKTLLLNFYSLLLWFAPTIIYVTIFYFPEFKQVFLPLKFLWGGTIPQLFVYQIVWLALLFLFVYLPLAITMRVVYLLTVSILTVWIFVLSCVYKVNKNMLGFFMESSKVISALLFIIATLIDYL